MKLSVPSIIDWLRTPSSLKFHLYGLILVCLFCSVPYSRAGLEPTDTHHFVLQAEAFLKGRLSIEASNIHDLAVYKDKLYVPRPPLPALMFLPFVALFGKAFPISFLACLLFTVLGFFSLDKICARLKLEPRLHVWVVAAFFLGTGYWCCLYHYFDSVYNAHIFSTVFLLAAIAETLGRCRVWLLGLLIGCAYATRSTTIFVTVFFAIWIIANHQKKDRALALRKIAVLAAIVGSFVLSVALFNYLRFGNPLEAGYFLIPESFLQPQVRKYGLFSLAHIPANLYYLLLQGFTAKGFGVRGIAALDNYGVSLPSASPFLLLAFFAPLNRPTLAAWAAIALTIASLSVYAFPGYNQFNCQRYALDFLPVLFMLMILGMNKQRKSTTLGLWKGFVAYACVLNAFLFLIESPTMKLIALWKGLFELHP